MMLLKRMNVRNQMGLVKNDSSFVLKVKYNKVGISIFYFYLQTIVIAITLANLHQKSWRCLVCKQLFLIKIVKTS